MKVYTIDEICTILDLNPPVLRKYSALLEDAGYKDIKRNSSNARYYTDDNLEILRELIDYKESGHMTLSDAARSLVARINSVDVIEAITPTHIESVAQRCDIERLENAFIRLAEHLEQTESKHIESMDAIVKELKEVKEELKGFKEEQTLRIEMKEQQAEKKKGFFSRFFK